MQVFLGVSNQERCPNWACHTKSLKGTDLTYLGAASSVHVAIWSEASTRTVCMCFVWHSVEGAFPGRHQLDLARFPSI